MRAIQLALIIALFILGIVAIFSPAKAHDWYTNTGCCSGVDCFSMSWDEIAIEPDGYRVKATGELIPYGKTRQTPEDGGGMFHRCTPQGVRDGRTLRNNNFYPQACFWAPFTGS